MSLTAVELYDLVGSLKHIQANWTVSALVEQDVLHWFLFPLEEHLLFQFFPLMVFLGFEFIFTNTSKSHGEGSQLVKTCALDDGPEIGDNNKSPEPYNTNL